MLLMIDGRGCANIFLDGFGMLVCRRPGKRRLADFDVALAMREAKDDRP
ncbi:MAG: hypothetical protein ACYCYL_09665 [Acidithiobacillus sp.]